MIDKDGRLFGKINIIDLLIIIFIVFMIFIIVVKLNSNKSVGSTSCNTYIIKFYTEEINDYIVNNINIGDNVLDDTRNLNLGKIIDKKIGDSIDFNANSDGKVISSSKEGYSSLEITTELKAQKFEHGILVNGNRYGVGHSLTIRAGKTILFLRISGIDEKDSNLENKEVGKLNEY